jgi:uncharacterized protein with NRDE domain
VELGKSRLHELHDRSPDHESLLAVVNDRQLASPEALHRQGLTGEMDQALSAQFIQAGHYGTRCSTTLWIEEGGTINWRETSYDETGSITGTVNEVFDQDPSA